MLMASIRDSYPGVGMLAATQLAQLNQLSQLSQLNHQLGHHMMLPHRADLPQRPDRDPVDAGAVTEPAGAGPGAGADADDRHSPPISRTYTYKKVTKPLLERKRRARINRCLDELKNLMVGALEAEGENVSKLEKADILELTVRHLQRITRPRDAAEDASRFQAGFSQCASEACHFLLGLPGLDAAVGRRLVAHLSQVVSGLRPPAYSPPSSPTPLDLLHMPHGHLPGSPASPEVSSSTPWGSCGARKREAEDSEDDPDDSDGPVNYTTEALRQCKEKQPRLELQADLADPADRDGRVSSSSAPSTPGSAAGSNGHVSDDEEKGPMWRPW